MLFCLAGVALRDIFTCLKKCPESFRVTGAIQSAMFSEDDLHSSWQAQHFTCAVLCVFCEPHRQGGASSGGKVQSRGRHGTWWDCHLRGTRSIW